MLPIDYTKKATETTDQYTSRIAGARGYSVQANPTGVSTTTNLATGAITPASMAPATAISPVTATETPIPSTPENPAPTVASVAPPTPLADQLSALIGDTVKGNNALLGRSADTSALNESLGVNAKTDVINGLSSQLTGLINESKAIPLQIQQSAQSGGANVTKGGLAPIQTASLRNNAIQSLAVSSQMDAARGDLATAISKVDRAMQAKYGPLEEANKARLANLDLLSKDPRLTREEKARTDFMTAKAEADKQKIADAKAVETAKHDAVLKAYSNFSTNPKFDSITQAAIKAATTDTEVAQILAHQGLSTVAAPKAETQLTKLDNGETVLVDTQTGKIISRLGGANPTGGTNLSTSIQTINGKTMLINTKTGEVIKDFGVNTTPSEIKAEQEKVDKAIVAIPTVQSKLLNLDSILSDKYMSTAVGSNTFGRTSFSNFATGGKDIFLSSVAQLTSQETLDKLIELKSAGGTLGALSDQERIMLQNAATALGGLAVKDGDGNIVGYKGTEQNFKKIIQGIKDKSKEFLAELEKQSGALPIGATTQLKTGATGTTASGVTWIIE